MGVLRSIELSPNEFETVGKWAICGGLGTENDTESILNNSALDVLHYVFGCFANGELQKIILKYEKQESQCVLPSKNRRSLTDPYRQKGCNLVASQSLFELCYCMMLESGCDEKRRTLFQMGASYASHLRHKVDVEATHKVEVGLPFLLPCHSHHLEPMIEICSTPFYCSSCVACSAGQDMNINATRSIDRHVIAEYGGKITAALAAIGLMIPLPLPAALPYKCGRGTDAFWIGRNKPDCRVLGIAAPGTMRKGINRICDHGPRIPLLWISLGTPDPNASQCWYTDLLCGAKQDTGGVLFEYS